MQPLHLAILGAGQLARMTAQAAQRLGVVVTVVGRPQDENPAFDVTPHQLLGDWSDGSFQRQVAAASPVITLENEFIAPEVLAQLAALGPRVAPGAQTLARLQDKCVQKEHLAAAGIPVPPFRAVASVEDVLRAAGDWGWPLMLKSRTHGYDGLGNRRVDGPGDVPAALAALQARSTVMVEGWVRYQRELAVTVVRAPGGTLATYAPVVTEQKDHICHVVESPARLAPDVAARARELAERMMASVEGVGCFTLEMFQCDGEVLANEVAPRPHNSAHHTLDSCVTSQFENHVRAVLGLPLGDPSQHAPAACMVNLLGGGNAESLAPTLQERGVHLHVYGKRTSRAGRKMGHVTVCGTDAVDVRQRALLAASKLPL